MPGRGCTYNRSSRVEVHLQQEQQEGGWPVYPPGAGGRRAGIPTRSRREAGRYSTRRGRVPAQWSPGTPAVLHPGYTLHLPDAAAHFMLPLATGRWDVAEPWALSWRFTLGGRTRASSLSLILFTFVRWDPSSFPSLPGVGTQRSDVTGATRLLAA